VEYDKANPVLGVAVKVAVGGNGGGVITGKVFVSPLTEVVSAQTQQ
jgi:nitrogen regulatory protein PII